MVNKKKNNYLSTSQVARLLGISRIAVFKQIKARQIPAKKIGRSYFISRRALGIALGRELSVAQKKHLSKVVDKAMREYGETFRLLGRE